MITCSTDLIAYQDGAISRGIAPCFAQLPVAELAAHMSRAEASLDESAFDFGFCEVVALLACASLAEAYPTMAQTGGDLGAPISISAQPLQAVRTGDLAYTFGSVAGNDSSGNAIAAGFRARAHSIIEQQSSSAASWIGGGPVIVGGC